MPDYDPKNIPILDDVIEDESDDAAASHEKIIITDEVIADEHTLDLFNDKTADIETDQLAPEIGSIDKFIDAATDSDVETIETLHSEKNIEDAVTVNHDQIPGIAEPPTISDPAITLDLDSIIDDIVSRLMPDLEQQLRSRLKQALQDQLPQELIEPTAPE